MGGGVRLGATECYKGVGGINFAGKKCYIIVEQPLWSQYSRTCYPHLAEYNPNNKTVALESSVKPSRTGNQGLV